MRRAPSHHSFLLLLTIAIAGSTPFVAAGCDAGPTLPLPPPTALIEGPPDAAGMVTVEVQGAEPGALVSALNQRLENGVIGTADESGGAILRLRADIGDVIQVWQRVGTESSELVELIVPGGPDGG